MLMKQNVKRIKLKPDLVKKRAGTLETKRTVASSLLQWTRTKPIQGVTKIST